MNEITQLYTDKLNDTLREIIISNPKDKDGVKKIKIRPIRLKRELLFQVEEFKGKQVFHQNLSFDDAVFYCTTQSTEYFKQTQLITATESVMILVSKKGKVTIKTQKISNESNKTMPQNISLDHNRSKQYILKEGIPVPFLIDLGVMNADGSIVRQRYDKFKQINRFLEFIQDILPKLPREKELTIIDFGCGKSYLTFAMYYYLKELYNYSIRIIGLDLKDDVINHCNQLSKRYGYDGLTFLHGDIADFTGVTSVDMVVTLHACDTATDYALYKAISWNAKVILSVPCCQHELNKQIKNETLAPIFSYGIIKERMASLMTDGLRGEILESVGYKTQLLEFIDMEHTPKNILIRAVYGGKPKDNKKEIERMLEEFHLEPTLWKLVNKNIPL